MEKKKEKKRKGNKKNGRLPRKNKNALQRRSAPFGEHRIIIITIILLCIRAQPCARSCFSAIRILIIIFFRQ